MKLSRSFFMLLGLLVTFISTTQANISQTIADHFERIKTQPEKLNHFLWNMPKGGDLHIHLAGSTYAENLLRYAQGKPWCIDPNTYTVFEDPNCSAEKELNNAVQNKTFYNQVINAWSMRNFNSKTESGHDHFFAAFGKFNPIVEKHRADVLAEVIKHAQLQNESYLELLVTFDRNQSGLLGKQIGWNANFESMRENLLSHGLDKIVSDMSDSIDQDEQNARLLLDCDRQPDNKGCKITVRYLYQTLREQAPEMVFAQLLTGFIAADKDPRIVGVNIVQPEDGAIAMRDYTLHMKMIQFLHKKYPDVAISLHAGELAEQLVPADGLQFHIAEAVYTANANRIGHGVDILYEKNYKTLLNDMAKKEILVEINLTSNNTILNAFSHNYPLVTYLKHHVPLTLSTDDEGISRSSLTQEYTIAATQFNLNYPTLKTFARNSLTYSFLPGEKLWTDRNYQQIAPACQSDTIGSIKPSVSCHAFLEKNEKAKMQWDLEYRFNQFETNFLNFN